MRLVLVDKKTEAEGTKSFFFEPEEIVSYLPGQYFYFTLPKLKFPDERGDTRHFTLSSSPTEGKTLRITTRVREESGFKKTLDELPFGSNLEGRGPNGTFYIPSSGLPAGRQVFIAGGIGITPFRSIIKFSADKNYKTPIHLIYSNSTPEQITFRKELEELAQNHKNIKVFMTVSKPEEGGQLWTGLIGRVDEKMIKSLITDHQSPTITWWLCGPPLMVEATEKILESLKITSDQIRIEKFTGY